MLFQNFWMDWVMQEKRLYGGLVITEDLEQCDVFEWVTWCYNMEIKL